MLRRWKLLVIDTEMMKYVERKGGNAGFEIYDRKPSLLAPSRLDALFSKPNAWQFSCAGKSRHLENWHN
jgi:hypothetical protein